MLTNRNRTHRYAIAATAMLAAVLMTGCSGYNNNRGRGDAPVGQQDRGAAEVISFPDQFGNVATKCDGHGHRIYVPTHNKSDAAVTVIDDPSCPGGATR